MTIKELQVELKNALESISEGKSLELEELKGLLWECVYLCSEYQSCARQANYLQKVMKKQIKLFQEILGEEEE